MDILTLSDVSQLYELIFEGFQFQVASGRLLITPPDQLDEAKAHSARQFIQEKKDLIISIIKKHPSLKGILHFNLPQVQIPLSFAQEGLWFVEQFEQGASAFNISMVFQAAPQVDLGILKKSLQGIIERHEILRTLIKKGQDSQGYQSIIPFHELSLEIPQTDLKDRRALHEFLKQEANASYDLSHEPPIRMHLCTLPHENNQATREHYLSIVIHHIAFDGWSIDLFVNELRALYAYYSGASQESNLPELITQYSDFSIWQRNYLRSSRLEQQLAYWKNKLTGYHTLNLITDQARPSRISYQGADVPFEIDGAVSGGLRVLAKTLKISLYSVLLSGYYLMLKVYSNQEDLVVGVPIAGRHHSQTEHLIGCFINTLVLRIQIHTAITVKDFIQQVGNEVLEGQLHQDLPLEKLVNELKVPKDTRRHPIFQVLFGLQNFGSTRVLENLLETYEPELALHKIAKLDLSTYLDDSQEAIKGYFNYATSLYEEATIRRYIATYCQILKEFSRLAVEKQQLETVKLDEIPCTDSAEYLQITQAWQGTVVAPESINTLHGLFEIQVLRTPDRVATAFEDKELTYQALNGRANQLAHYLAKMGVGPGTQVALFLEHSLEMTVGILGILKTGAAYVPMYPSHPADHLQLILDDAQVPIILSNRTARDRIPSSFALVICLDEDWDSIAKDSASTNPTAANSAESQPAYIIYTSGSTGQPKGVIIEHNGVVNTLSAQLNYLRLRRPTSKPKVFGLLTNYTFDASVPGIFLPLISGNKLCIANDLSKIDVSAFMREYQVNVTIVAAKMLPILVDNTTSSLECVVTGGEKPEKAVINRLLQSGVKIVQEYGLTETSVVATFKEIGPSTKMSHIGRPIPNVQVYILDPSLQVLPAGAVGELYIGGAGIARGYLNQPELTEEKFIENPFQTAGENKKLYRTGDLARWLPDGNLEYIGRNDLQVKIRGYRIEIGEIEATLMQYPGIKQTAVVVANNIIAQQARENHVLIGYYVANKELDTNKILQFIAGKIPNYMVPDQLIHLEQLPLTVNGKLDRKSLPQPDTNAPNKDHEVPRNELEQKIRDIWSEVLGISQHEIGIHDDFFKLGGDSIISIQLVSKIRRILGLSISVKDIFSTKTIAAMHDQILTQNTNDEKIEVVQSMQNRPSGIVPLLPIQTWFFANNFKQAQHWNQSFLIKTPALDIQRLEACLEQLFDYHDAFRLRYQRNEENARYEQYYDEQAVPVNLKQLDIQSLHLQEGTQAFDNELKKILTQWQQNLDLENGPTYCVAYIHGYADGSSRIFFALHHLIVDTVSWRIITDDLKKYYHQEPLPPKGTSYQQWGHCLKLYAQNNEAEKSYWQKVMDDYQPKVLEKNIASESITNTASFSLTKGQTQQLLRGSHQAYHTQINDLLLASLAYTLSDITQQPVNHIVLEGHGREELDKTIDLSHTIGWFTTMYPVRLEAFHDLGRTIKTTKETLRRIPNKGTGFGVLFGYDTKTLPQVSFNYLGQFDTAHQGTDNQNLWCIANEDAGVPVDHKNSDPNILNILGHTMGGQLHFNIHTKLSRAKTAYFITSFKKHLEQNIEHTVSQKRSYLTASDVDNIIHQEFLDVIQKDREVANVFLANSLQQGFVYHALSQGDTDDTYRIQFIWEYHHLLNVEKLKLAWQYAQNRFAILRMRLFWEEELVQVIDRQGILDWRYIDISQQQPGQQQRSLQEIQQKDKKEVYDFNNRYLFRIYLIKLRSKHYQCIFSYHHAMIDGWSNPRLLGYVHDAYIQLVENTNDFVFKTENTYEVSQKYLQQHRGTDWIFWEKYLAQIEERPELNGLITPQHKEQSIRLSEYRQIQLQQELILIIQGELYKRFKTISETEGITINTCLQYAWHKALSIYGNISQTVVGTTVSGRNLPIDNIEQAVGLYINTLPMIVNHQHEKGRSIVEVLREVQASITEISSHSNTNLAELQQGSERLFDSIMVYENYPSEEQDPVAAKLKIRYQPAYEQFDYPLGVIAYEERGHIAFKLKYAGELFDTAAMKQLLQTVENLLTQITGNPTGQVQALSYVNTAQLQQLVYDWNITDRAYPQNKAIHVLFEEQVARTPESSAVVYKKQKLTYHDLNTKANQLANFLKERHVLHSESLVAICLDRDEHILIAILAILKAGGAYVPIDPTYPEKRIEYMLRDTQAVAVLTNTGYQKRLNALAHHAEVIAVNTKALQKQLTQQASTNLSPPQNHSRRLAYVIYTSGTTGMPKGVMVEHHAFVATIEAVRHHYFNHSQAISTYSMTNVVFDIFGLEYGLPLLTGGKIILGDINAPTINCKGLDFVQMTPQVCELKLGYLKNYEATKLLIGGENLSHTLMKRVLERNINMANVYGPTETTIWSTGQKYLYEDRNKAIYVGLGKPFYNEKVYVLDAFLRVLPVGAIGTLYIGGVGLARGYWNQPKLTAEKFIANPFQTPEEKKQNKNVRIYKTGDLVRWLPDGNLEYIGREDSQVKIRGHRIELGEVEAALQHCPGVSQSVVTVKEQESNTTGKHDVLIGYYSGVYKLPQQAILQQIRAKLPDYMVPSHLIYVTHFPLSPAGKLDKKALPLPTVHVQGTKAHRPPRNEVENNLRRMWSEVLDLFEDQIGIHDDFFALGGNSILVIRLVSKINYYYQSSLKIADVFVFKNIETLALHIFRNKKPYQPIVKLNTTYDQPNMFMIHPGTGGCEAYVSLAGRLSHTFSCYGVDSYNLYNAAKILDLDALAAYYLEHIDQIQQATHREEYILLGWSLGGQIALEIASILEQRGKTRTKVYILDTVLYDEYLLQLNSKVDVANLKAAYRDYAQMNAFEESYTERVIANIEVEGAFLKQPISSKLATTKVLLFKAMQDGIGMIEDEKSTFYRYIASLKYNNIDKAMSTQENLEVVNVADYHHLNLIENEELLTSKIAEKK